MNYGKAIKVLRASRGLTQKQLSLKAELDTSYISLIENGHRSPSLDRLEVIAGALGVPLYLLVLLASDKEELRGLSESKADELGKMLLTTLLEVEAQAR